MKKLLVSLISIVVCNILNAQVNFPEVFPKEIINKVICRHTEVYAKNYFSGKTDYTMSTDFDYKIFISELDGIYVEYNYGERWNDPSRFGTTQKITTFDFWKKEDKYMTDKYGDITSEWTVYHYKVYPNYQDKHYIKELQITEKKNGERSLSLTINVPSHQDANITAALESYDVKSKTTVSNVCDRLKTKKDFENEEKERKVQEEKQKEIAKIKLDKQNLDKLTAKNIRAGLLSSNSESVITNWKLLNFPENYSLLKDSVINFVASKENNSAVDASQDELKKFIEKNKNALLLLGNSYSENRKTTIAFDNQNRPSANGFVWTSPMFKDYGSGIITYQKINFILDFSVSTTDNEKKEPVIYSSSKASIAQKLIGDDFYEVNFLTLNYLLENNVVTTTYDASIKDKYLKIIWPMLKTVNVNGITLGTTETSITTEEKLNPRIVRKTIRLIGITSTLGAAGYLYYLLYM